MTQMELDHNNALLAYTFVWIAIGLIISVFFLLKEKWDNRYLSPEKLARIDAGKLWFDD